MDKKLKVFMLIMVISILIPLIYLYFKPKDTFPVAKGNVLKEEFIFMNQSK